MALIFRAATVDDAVALFPRLRKVDAREVELSNGPDVLDTLIKSVEASEICTCVEDEDGVICLYGVARLNPYAGAVWMLAADSVYNYQRELITEAKAWLEEVKPRYPILCNFVHAENTRSIRWLKLLGFTFGDIVEDYGVGKAPFIPFHI